MSILSRLANNEMSYWGLSFVGRSWIVRKEVGIFHGVVSWKGMCAKRERERGSIAECLV